MKITHEAGNNIVTLNSAEVGAVVRYDRGFYGVVVNHDRLGRGVMWLENGKVDFEMRGDAAVLRVVDAELVIRDGGFYE